MAALVGALRAMLTLDSTAFVSGANKAQKSGKKLEGGLAALGGTMKKVGLGLAVAATGLGVAIKGQLNAADEMGKAAQKFGVGVEELSRLKYAADLSDVSLETLGISLRALSKNMVGAMKDGSAQAKMFQGIGVSVTDTSGKMRSTEAVMQDVADVMAKMPDGAEKTAMAMKMFGRSGAEMIPLLNGGKQSLKDMADEANKLGIVITKETSEAAQKFNDNLNTMSQVAGGLLLQITAALAPTLAKMSEWAKEAAIAFGQLSPETKELVVQIGAIVGVVAVAAAGFGFLALALSPVTIAIAAIAAGALLIYENWDNIAAWFSEQWASIKASTEEAWAAVEKAIGDAIAYVQGKWDTFVGKLQAAVQIAKDVGTAIKDAMKLPDDFGNKKAAGYGGLGSYVPGGGSDIGGNTADGVVDGLVDGVVQRQGDIDGAADFITSRFKDRLQIQSPSKVFRQIGQYLTEGLALGIGDNAPKAEAALGDTADKMTKSMEKLGDLGKQASSAIRSAFDGLFDDPARALKDLAKQLAQMALYRGLANAFPGAFGAGGAVPLVANANGNAFNHGAVQAFATGGIVSKATAFGMRGGKMGVMGEAGPEAIMPLTRIGGKLGVAAQGGGGSNVAVNVFNQSGGEVEQRESRGPNGERQIDIMIGKSLSGGRQDGAMRARYGTPPNRMKR